MREEKVGLIIKFDNTGKRKMSHTADKTTYPLTTQLDALSLNE
jgi:hypothetical protein